jgi:hypothetical protein
MNDATASAYKLTKTAEANVTNGRTRPGQTAATHVAHAPGTVRERMARRGTPRVSSAAKNPGIRPSRAAEKSSREMPQTQLPAPAWTSATAKTEMTTPPGA